MLYNKNQYKNLFQTRKRLPFSLFYYHSSVILFYRRQRSARGIEIEFDFGFEGVCAMFPILCCSYRMLKVGNKIRISIYLDKIYRIIRIY